MTRRPTRLIATLFAVASVHAVHAGDATFELFEKRIRPIFSDTCQDCHGTTKQKGGLRLDSKVGWTRGGESGPVIVPGKPDDSLLITAVRYWDKSLQMPPKHALDRQEVDNLIEWVKQGALDPRDAEPAAESAKRVATFDLTKGREHWAFQPVKNAPVPDPENKAWVRNEVDRFTLSAMEHAGVKPAPDKVSEVSSIR